MKQYVIAQHPIKLTLELDDEWLRSIGADDSDIDEIALEWEAEIKKAAIAMHAAKAQMDASEAMKGGGK